MCVYLKNGYKNQGARVIKSKNQKVHHTCVCVCVYCGRVINCPLRPTPLTEENFI